MQDKKGIKNQVCVCIPIYKEKLNSFEELSVKHNIKILNDDICFFAPEGLDINYYSQFAYKEIIYFDKSYFISTDTYNSLLLNPVFYEKFNTYSFILICQPDAFVFIDNLKYWCSQGYDYIGAPWIGKHFNKMFRTERSLQLMPFLKYPVWYLKARYNNSFRVGNGGFSLRKVDSMIHSVEKYCDVIKDWDLNEDNFFSMYVPFYEKKFKIPGIKEAVAFSIENSPELALRLNNNQLPFGCHNWYNGMFINFWKKYIKIK